jgi:DNA-binding GntR family transcriptional regulator
LAKSESSVRTAAASPTLRRKGTGTLRAYEEIRNQILNLDLEPGKALEEHVLLGTLRVSRTPVREALIRLAAEGLVDLLPNRGARVSEIDLTKLREFFEALDVNQRMATRWAATRRTPEQLKNIDGHRRAFEAAVKTGSVRPMMDTNLDFHAAIGEASGNALVARHYRDLLTFGLRLSRLALVYDGPDPHGRRPQHLKEIISEHRAMVAHLTSGDADGAEGVARNHTGMFRRRVSEYLAHSLADDITV